MLRRPFTEEPVSRLAAWSSRCGLFALVVAALSIFVVRSGYLEIIPSLATFGAALALAALAILLALASSVPIWRHGYSGIGRAVLGFFLGCALLAYPAYLGYRATKLPAITDISTDTVNPPKFDVLARLRPRNAVDYPAGNAALQRAAYTDVMPLQVLTTPKIAYDATLSVINKRRMNVVGERPPAPGRREGTVEIVARSLIMGLRDDVVIRVAPLGNGAQIDVRSAARFGRIPDFGANASRITALLTEIDEAVSAATPDRQPEQDKRQPQRRQPTNR